MELLETNFRSRLMVENEEYQRLFEQHERLKEKLELLSTRRPFTQRDWFEESAAKKRKLLIKDRMATLAREANELEVLVER